MTTAKFVKTNRAFTLVEMLVVIAITAVLFTLLLSPLVNSFRLTQRAQMQVAAQDQARITLENLTRELGSAAYVFGNTTLPFPQTSPDSNIRNLHFSDFLVLTIPKVTLDANGNITGTPTTTTAVAFDAKLDFVLPRHNAAGTITDPTTGGPVTVNPITGNLGPAGLTFPLAPGTTMIRYWVGLRDPTKAYATRGEGAQLAGQGNNTYILYRAQFTPYTTSGGTTGINTALFATTTNAQGQTVPEFDDPDFFRVVTTSDINWLSPTHADYSASEVTAHNTRVQKWFQIAKPVVNLPNADLILLPHNASNGLAFDPNGGEFPGVAHDGEVHDPVSGINLPVVNTSVTFRPASVSADATAATATDNVGQGYGGDVTAANNGLPYVPTTYTATDQSWSFPYHISLYQPGVSSYAAFQTAVPEVNASFSNGATITPADLIEYMYSSQSDTTGTPVYDVTTGKALVTTGDYVPMTVTPDTGTVSFDLPALPDPANPYLRYWSLSPALFANGGALSSGIIDLSGLANAANVVTSPLQSIPTNGTAPTVANPYEVQNARLVPASVRVYGPDGTAGPNLGQSVLYTQVFPGDADFGPNEYIVNYTTNSLTLYVDPATHQLPTAPNGTSANVQIAFDYQANLAPVNTQPLASAPTPLATPISDGTPAGPYTVKVDYQTRDLLDINLGVRVYDPNNVGPAEVVTVHNQVRIGNSNR